MRQTLGKLILILLFLTHGAFAGVKATVNAPAVYKGDMVTYTITADGGDISFPNISEIGGSRVVGTSSSQSIQIINGATTRTISKSYTFSAQKSLTIPSYSVTVDGQTLKTDPVEVSVVKPTASQNGAPFVLQMQVDKNSSHVGEPIDLTVAFKRKLNASVDKVQLDEPKLENFWVKKIESANNKVTQEGDYVVEKIHYKLFPQKAGEYHIPSLVALVGQASRRSRGGFFDDPFFNMGQSLTWRKVYSNELTIKVEALPNGLELYGNYVIEAKVDKKVVSANKPVNLNIVVKGEGNIDDVKKFELDIPNVIVYADEPKISSQLVHNIYQGEFREKVALIADRNFTIPVLSLDYFDKKTQSLKTISTEPIEIEVKGGVMNKATSAPSIEVSPSQKVVAQPEVKVETKIVKEDAYVKYLFLLLGFVLGLLTMFGVSKFNGREPSSEVDIVKAIRKAKDDKALFNLLLPYANKHKEVAEALNKLEKNIYKGGNETIDREILMEVFEELGV